MRGVIFLPGVIFLDFRRFWCFDLNFCLPRVGFFAFGIWDFLNLGGFGFGVATRNYAVFGLVWCRILVVFGVLVEFSWLLALGFCAFVGYLCFLSVRLWTWRFAVLRLGFGDFGV